MQVRKLKTYSIEVKHDCTEAIRFSYLLLSDVHWDNPHCDRALLKKHLDMAKVRGAGIMVFGDFFCAMQGKYDPRGAKGNIRPEHDVPNYLDALVDSAAEYLLPYREKKGKNLRLEAAATKSEERRAKNEARRMRNAAGAAVGGGCGRFLVLCGRAGA